MNWYKLSQVNKKNEKTQECLWHFSCTIDPSQAKVCKEHDTSYQAVCYISDMDSPWSSAQTGQNEYLKVGIKIDPDIILQNFNEPADLQAAIESDNGEINILYSMSDPKYMPIINQLVHSTKADRLEGWHVDGNCLAVMLLCPSMIRQ